MEESTQTGPHSGSLNLMIDWLGGQDKEKIGKATSILLDIGQPVVEYLIQEAIKPGKHSEHRVRLLDLVARIGRPLGADEFFNLQRLLRDHSPAVRQKVVEVFAALSPGGLPRSPDSAALARAFNPAYWAPPHRPRPTRRHSGINGVPRDVAATLRRKARARKDHKRRGAAEAEKSHEAGGPAAQPMV